MESPSRALPANTRRLVPGTTRNACAVKNDLTKPISDPIFRAASWPVALAYSPRDGSTGSSRVSRMIAPENDDSRNCGNSRSIEQLIFHGQPLVEDARPLELIRAGDADLAA